MQKILFKKNAFISKLYALNEKCISITYTCFSIAENQINVQQKETVTCWVSKLMWAFAVIMPCIISLCTLYCELLLIYSSNTNAKDCAYILVICSELKKELNEYIYKNLLLLIFVLNFLCTSSILRSWSAKCKIYHPHKNATTCNDSVYSRYTFQI